MQRRPFLPLRLQQLNNHYRRYLPKSNDRGRAIHPFALLVPLIESCGHSRKLALHMRSTASAYSLEISLDWEKLPSQSVTPMKSRRHEFW